MKGQSTVRRRSVRKPNSDEMAQLAATEYSNNSEKLLHQVFEEFDQKLSHTKQVRIVFIILIWTVFRHVFL